jgi:hypothetical protein
MFDISILSLVTLVTLQYTLLTSQLCNNRLHSQQLPRSLKDSVCSRDLSTYVPNKHAVIEQVIWDNQLSKSRPEPLRANLGTLSAVHMHSSWGFLRPCWSVRHTMMDMV